MNGVQQVSNWTLFDVIPIIFTEPNVDGSIPSTLQITAGVNGWDWSLQQGGGNIVGAQSALYG
jgi:hypothetical protein